METVAHAVERLGTARFVVQTLVAPCRSVNQPLTSPQACGEHIINVMQVALGKSQLNDM